VAVANPEHPSGIPSGRVPQLRAHPLDWRWTRGRGSRLPIQVQVCASASQAPAPKRLGQPLLTRPVTHIQDAQQPSPCLLRVPVRGLGSAFSMSYIHTQYKDMQTDRVLCKKEQKLGNQQEKFRIRSVLPAALCGSPLLPSKRWRQSYRGCTLINGGDHLWTANDSTSRGERELTPATDRRGAPERNPPAAPERGSS
jgi:hypothetical protein